jgi:hypothetical protein
VSFIGAECSVVCARSAAVREKLGPAEPMRYSEPPMRVPLLSLIAAASTLVPAIARAQSNRLDVVWPTGEHNPQHAIVSADFDDDDDDGVPDALAEPPVDPARDDEVVAVTVLDVNAGAVRVRAEGGVRIVTRTGLVGEATLPVGANGRAVVPLVGVAASRTTDDATVTFTAGESTVRVSTTVASAAVLHGDNRIVWAHRDAVRLSEHVTNDDTLPRTRGWNDVSPDPENVRVELWDPGASRAGSVRLESIGTSASIGVAPGIVRNAIADTLVERPREDVPLRSRFVRLVGDDIDLRAPGVQGQTLLVGLRDRVRVRYRRSGAAGEVTTDVRFGRPGNENGPLAARAARWHLVIMRDHPGGRPVIGGDDSSATRIAREQVSISNEVYAQCMMTFGTPSTYPVTIADPPNGSLLAVADDDGVDALGGEIRFRVNGRGIGPIRTHAGWRAIDTAEAIADAVRSAGFSARATQNRRVDYGAGGSADVVIRDRDRLAEITMPASGALTTDLQQSISIGRVDLSDGIEEFNNLNSSAGTLEERTLLKSLMDDDVTSIDLFVVNRYTHQTRIGEAFVEGDGGALLNALIIDRAGIAAQREAWTQSHEAGHIFLNQPWHPDNMGPDRPWLLMDADASLGAVTGPKRLTAEECRRITAESGVDATPSLLRRYDEVTPSPRAPQFASWPERDPYPRTLPPAPASAPTTNASRPREREQPAAHYGVELE